MKDFEKFKVNCFVISQSIKIGKMRKIFFFIMHMNFSEIVGYLPYLSIPIVSALVGWITNIVAINMMFYPIDFIGIRPFGWQGIIPSKAKKMAETAVKLWTTKLLDIGVQFSKIKPDKVAEEMAPSVDHLSKQIIDEVMEAKLPKIWQRTPQGVKQNIYKKVGRIYLLS